MAQQFSIIDDNDLFVVVNKFHHVDFHTIDDVLGIVQLVKQHLNLSQLFPVHRLDKMTSGLIIMAKTKVVAAQFGQLFSDRQISKYYLALSDKKPKKKQGLIKGDMKKGRNGSYLLLKSNDNPAITQFFSYSLQPGLRVFVLKPHSGKTHQLRVAMKSIGAPILGDTRYYPASHQSPIIAKNIGRLHAWQLSFSLLGHDYHYQVTPDWQDISALTNWLDVFDISKNCTWPVL